MEIIAPGITIVPHQYILLKYIILDALDMADQYLADLNFKKAIEKYTEVLKNKSIIPEGVPEEEIYSRRAQCYHKLRKFKEARV